MSEPGGSNTSFRGLLAVGAAGCEQLLLLLAPAALSKWHYRCPWPLTEKHHRCGWPSELGRHCCRPQGHQMQMGSMCSLPR